MSNLVTHESNLSSLKDIPPVIQHKIMPHPKPKTGPAYKPVVKENQVVSISAIDSVKWMIDYGQYFHFYCTLGES